MFVCLLAASVLSACATLPANAPKLPQDPWESWNRGVYKFNDALDRGVAKPVAKTYQKVVPKPVRGGVSNFFANLETPTVMINDLLQGKVAAAANDLGRFLMNSTIGLAGILDPASRAGMNRNKADFGQTLGAWGVHTGPFVELPLFGPSDLRDAPGRVVDHFTNPLNNHVTNPHRYVVKNTYAPYALTALSFVDVRTELLSLDDTLTHVYDPYAFIRDAYLQRRAYMVSGNKVKEDVPLEDPGSDADSVVAPAPATPVPTP
jgi:phospholipid-binding lipoprotein MlaA